MFAPAASALLQYFQHVPLRVALIRVEPDGSSIASWAVVFEANSKRKRPNRHFDLLVVNGPIHSVRHFLFRTRGEFLEPDRYYRWISACSWSGWVRRQ